MNNSSTGINNTVEDFDFEALRLPQDYQTLANVNQLIVNIPIRKPNRHEFFRTHPTLVYESLFFVDANDKELYLIDAPIREELRPELVAKVLYPYVNRHGELKLWSIRLPNAEGKLDGYNRTALAAALEAKSKWIRIKTVEGIGSYVVEQALLQTEPKWPPIVDEADAMVKILKLALKDNIIKSLDHPVLKKAVFGLA
jgi:hypothetical protein